LFKAQFFFPQSYFVRGPLPNLAQAGCQQVRRFLDTPERPALLATIPELCTSLNSSPTVSLRSFEPALRAP
jgi:hypothetical protein